MAWLTESMPHPMAWLTESLLMQVVSHFLLYAKQPLFLVIFAVHKTTQLHTLWDC